MNKRWLVIPLVFIALTLAACQPASSNTEPTSQPSAAAQGVIVQGRVEPAQSIDIAFSSNGQVTEVLFGEGDTVSAGQVIGRLSGREARLTELARAEQELAAAEQALRDLQDEAKLQVAQAELKVVEARKALDSAQEKVDDLDAQSDPDEMEVQEAGARLSVAQAQLDAAQDEAAAWAGGPDPRLVEAAELRINTAQAALNAAQTALDGLELRAPLAGTLVGFDLQAGQFVTAGQTVGSIADFNSWVVLTDDLTELEVVQITTGETARLTLDALPETTMSAEVTRIAQRFEEKRGDITYTVTLAIKDPAAKMRWGMTGQILFAEGE
jgi:HlyD family secretion protein